MPHKVVTGGDLQSLAVKHRHSEVRPPFKVGPTWTAGLNHLEETEGWRVVAMTQSQAMKEPIIILYREPDAEYPGRQSVMAKISPEQFAEIVKAAAENNYLVKNVRIDGFWVKADIASRSRKSSSEWSFLFDAATGFFEYRGPYSTANQPIFFGEAVRAGIRKITGS